MVNGCQNWQVMWSMVVKVGRMYGLSYEGCQAIWLIIVRYGIFGKLHFTVLACFIPLHFCLIECLYNFAL